MDDRTTTRPAEPEEKTKLEIPTTPVESSSVAAIGYDEASGTLAIVFTSGTKYHYEAIPLDLWAKMQDAESVGRFYAQQIRGKFTGTKQEQALDLGADLGGGVLLAGHAAILPEARP